MGKMMTAKPVKIINKRNSRSLELVLELCDSLHTRARGLMFRKECVPLFFEFDYAAKHGIHSFFVGFKFDAIYLDSDNRITSIFQSVPPFSLYLQPKKDSTYLLEVPPGKLSSIEPREGDMLEIKWVENDV
jgi:uncharacterized membrane protein (UPF0127 family)